MLVVVACDPISTYIITTKQDHTVVEIYPSLESVYCPEFNDPICKFARSHAIKEGTYEIRSDEKMIVFAVLGTKGAVSQFPLEKVKIIRDKDTLVLQGREQIFERFVRGRSPLRYYFDYP